jgi:shikimate dehydrogenase
MNRAFKQMGIDGVYVAFRVPAGRISEAISGLKALGAAGANVTYPHKEAVLPFVVRASSRVGIIRAANTLHFADDGTYGYNTDATGTAIVLERFAGLSLEGKKVCIFGAGGGGRAAALGVLEVGASSVVFCVRDPSKAVAALSRLRNAYENRSFSIVSLGMNGDAVKCEEAIRESDVIINATPVGMYGTVSASGARVLLGNNASTCHIIGNPEWIRAGHYCLDLVYGSHETEFLRIARTNGATCLSGRSLLVAQALESFRRWTGHAFDLEEMARAVESFITAGAAYKKE